jgi:hypothetical protein
MSTETLGIDDPRNVTVSMISFPSPCAIDGANLWMYT